MIKAAIDIGTNSTRLLVAKIKDLQKTDLHREARITRLGQSVEKTKIISAEAMKRTIDVLKDYRKIGLKLGVKSFVVGATSAARDAQNINDFIDKVRRTINFEIRVLTPEEEATLSFIGATSEFCNNSSHASHLTSLVIDIGGGSTELILGKSGAAPRGLSPNQSNKDYPHTPIALSFSKNIGSVRLTEMFINNDPPLEQELKKAANYIEQVYSEPVNQILKSATEFQIIGTAGTITTLAAINLGLEVYDSQKVHCSALSFRAIEKIFGRLKILTVKQRKKIKVIQPGRADVIPMGSLILLTLMKMLKVEELIVSENDLLDGLLIR